MGVRYTIMAKTGEANGKAMYAKIGVVLEGDKGFSMKLNVVPLNWDGYAFFAEPEQQRGNGGGGYSRGASPPRGGGGRQGPDNMDDDIPF